MDLTNIKPCVECKKADVCKFICDKFASARAEVRCTSIFVDGRDCFEEVDDGRCTNCHGYGKPQFIDWLKQPAEEET